MPQTETTIMEDIYNTDIRLPAEILLMICSHMSKQDQLRSRLASRKLNYAATIHVFQSLRLMPEGKSSKHFQAISLSDTLRPFVKEVTIDTERIQNKPGVEGGHETWALFGDFYNSLPHMRFFQNLTRLHIRLKEFSMPFTRYSMETDIWKQFRVLDAISCVVTGLWTQDYENNDDQVQEGIEQATHCDQISPSGQPLKIKELTVSNLVTFKTRSLNESEAWNKLLRLPTLVDLKCLIGEKYGLQRYDSLHCAHRENFFQSLPSQSLSPKVVEKLQVLSLFHSDYWGWFPRMDLTEIGALPNLKVLALGHYVFTDQRQTDWIASLGTSSKSGGLEELYLDGCAILYRANQFGPLASDGYPVRSTVSDGLDRRELSLSLRPVIEDRLYITRWHGVLSGWRVTMTGLKKMVMGTGDRDCPFLTSEAVLQQEGSAHIGDLEMQWLFRHNRHRYFACPEPEELGIRAGESDQTRRDKAKNATPGKYLHGTGLLQKRRTRMQYVSYDVTLDIPWRIMDRGMDDDAVGVEAPEGETIKFDDAAYALLMETIRDRLRS
ncbi:hypothetical protein FPHYL_3758 [Fusarium phyllophilum]|uniref:F-box domain-containing protein n=1 Tax=Fusarium phyllophilum TaxID=47803 RepID=A0A8H5K399_9HYPO|nr:hypothetical protein FPHYL_3758 [Fusarium phyllophilum]